MKPSFILFAVLVAASSFAVEVAELPCAAFPDTEVSTNFPLAVVAAANRKLVFTLELQASPSRTSPSPSILPKRALA